MMRLLWSVLIFVVSCNNYTFGGTPFFRKDYEYNELTQNFYKVNTIARTWIDAKRRCELEGAALFTPDSKQDYDAVVALMQATTSTAFIGIYDLLSQGNFITFDGKNLDDVYHVWDEGEPNNEDDMEHCVVLKKTGTINDINCLIRRPFICKKSISTLKWNVLCDMPYLGYTFDKDLGKCYKLHLQPKNWTEAFGVCAAEESYLAIINSKAESEHFVKMVADAPKDTIKVSYLSGAVHLGFHNLFGDGFTTIQGVPLQDSGYSVWGGCQPDNAGGGPENCGSMFYDGTLNDIGCHFDCIFMCEHDMETNSSNIADGHSEENIV